MDDRRKKKQSGTLRLLFGKKDGSKGRKIKVTKRKKERTTRRSRDHIPDRRRGRDRDDRRSRVEEEDEGEEEEERGRQKMTYREKRELRRKVKIVSDSENDVEKRRKEEWKKKKSSRRRRSASVSMGNLPKDLRQRYGTLGGVQSDASIRKGKEVSEEEKSKEGGDWKGFFSPDVKNSKRRRAQSVSRGRPQLKRQDSQGLFGTLKDSIFGKKTPKKLSKDRKVFKGDPMFLSPSKPIDNWDGYEIHEICFNGDVMKLFDLVKSNRDLNASNEDQNTPLHFSCALGKTLCVKELLKHHDLNTSLPNCKGDYPLHIASRKGHADIVKLMIKDGRFNMYEKNREGKTCFELASNDATKRVFEKQIRIEEKFLSAVTKKRFSICKEQLSKGAHVNCTRLDANGKNKLNALDILYSTKNLAELDDQGDLIRMLVHRGCNVSKAISRYESKYMGLLQEGYLRSKRYNFLREIIQTEKVYNDDLWITLNLFAEPLKEGASGTEKTSKIFKSIKKKEMQKKLARFWSTLEDIRKVVLKNTINLSKKFKTYSYLIQETEGSELCERTEELAQAEQEYMSCLEGVDLEPYIKFCYQQSFMEGWVRKKREYSEVYKFYRRQEQKIPLPRIRDGGFVSMLSKVRNRLFKYRGFLECIIKYTDCSLSDDYMEILKVVLKHIMDGLEKINKDAGDIENKKQMLSIHRLFKERYNIKMLVQNKNRKYICHETNFKAFNMESLEVNECDIYVFSDSVFFGSKRGGGFEFYWYNQKKTTWVWHDDHFRLMIYNKREDGGKKIVDYIVPCTFSYTWFKEMKEFFTKHHPTFYYNHIFLHSSFSFDKEMEEFRILRIEEDEIKIRRRMMMNFKNRSRTAEEKAQRYTNKAIDEKKTIDMLRRERKKNNNSSSSATNTPSPSGENKKKSNEENRVQKVKLRIKVTMDSDSSPLTPEEKLKREQEQRRLSRIHTPDEETPVKVVFEDEMFDFSLTPGGGEIIKTPNRSDSVFETSPQARRLFETPPVSSEKEQEKKEELEEKKKKEEKMNKKKDDSDSDSGSCSGSEGDDSESDDSDDDEEEEGEEGEGEEEESSSDDDDE